MSATSIAEAESDVQSAVVARQNDAFRAALLSNGGSGFPGKTVCTQGIAAEGPLFMAELLHAVATFDAFNEDNDPYGDHTFGVLEVSGTRVYWKIDLYDEEYEFGSEDPADPERTRRVLTLLLPSEY
jgi:hypothetical protein